MINNKLLYCADCVNCKVVNQFNNDKSTFVKKIRCSKEQWQYPSGKEKLYDYFNLLQHRPDFCIFYDPMSETSKEQQEYIKDLQAKLPRDRIIYEAETGKEVALG